MQSFNHSGMLKWVLASAFYLVSQIILAQSSDSSNVLTVKKIMQDPKVWIGTSPHDPWWSEDGQTVYFYWNPDQNDSDSVYQYNTKTGAINKSKTQPVNYTNSPYQDSEKAVRLYLENGDLYEREKGKSGSKIVENVEGIQNIYRNSKGAVFYTLEGNLYKLNRKVGSLTKLTNFKTGKPRNESEKLSDKDAWLKQDQLAYFKIIQKKEKERLGREQSQPEKGLKPQYVGDRLPESIVVNPTENYITFLIREEKPGTSTIVPDYVTETGYTKDLRAREKVGENTSNTKLGIYIRELDSIYYADFSALPDLHKKPAYLQDYPINDFVKDTSIIIHGPRYSPVYPNRPLFEIRSMDNKDRWIVLYNLNEAKWSLVDHQHDEAWIGGPGIGWLFSPGELGWLPNGQGIWYQSEADGFSHLYTYDLASNSTTQLTKGSYEIYDPQISQNGKFWYFHSNQVHSGEHHFYRMPIGGGKAEQLTNKMGRHEVLLSPDEKTKIDLFSQANHPPELYISKTDFTDLGKKITFSQTPKWSAYSWRTPDYINFEARDGAQVPARLYQPADSVKNGAAVIFVHGAGYLQNAHKWWSSYFREYMFHNLLTDLGYTVLDIDYRGSAGYGRDWRTAIYRHMGGKDLSDQVDGAGWLVNNHGVDASRIGIYGGSYGGFITLMALFTEPNVFAAGAALRSVTDWAHYNHPYTSNILNEPANDSLAYARSSPIYYAEGLSKPLLICHGMVDTNVHYQDVVRLAQRLIELGKEEWELAVYPVEGHGFEEPSSWTDEYRRILELFNRHLTKPEN
jgi:dipeptidyl aminopeptidase/acylaminoacyl peptidase